MTDIIIEKATEQNIIPIADLTRKFFPYMNMNADKVFERMKQGVKYIVAKDAEGKTIGFADYEIIEKPAETHPGMENKRTAKILGVCVDEKFQRQGVGRKLLEAVLEETKGITQIALLVDGENSKAIRMYENYGFRHNGKLARQIWGKEILMMVRNGC